MSAATFPAGAAAPADSDPAQLRVAPMAVLVAAYWIAYFAIGMADVDGFHKFLARLGALAILLVSFLVWWFLRRSIPLRHRLAPLGAAVGAAVITFALRDRSIAGPLTMSILLPAIAVTITGWTIWLLISNNLRQK